MTAAQFPLNFMRARFNRLAAQTLLIVTTSQAMIHECGARNEDVFHRYIALANFKIKELDYKTVVTNTTKKVFTKINRKFKS